jgi:hypothetical protein
MPVMILDNEKIRTVVLTNGAVLDAFPSFYAFRAKTVAVNTCPTCRRSDAEKKALAAIEQCRQAIGRLSNSDKAKLRALLGGNPCRVYWTSGTPGNETRNRADF